MPGNYGVNCGSVAGFVTHLRLKEEPCEVCSALIDSFAATREAREMAARQAYRERERVRRSSPANRERDRERKSRPEYKARKNELRRVRRATDPGYRAKENVRRQVREDNRLGVVRSERSQSLAALYSMAGVTGPVVYFVERDGFIKIGTTKFLRARLTSIAKGGTMPEGMTVGPVRLLGTAPGTFAEEKRIHERFEEWRLGSSEWFYPSPGLLDFIREICAEASV